MIVKRRRTIEPTKMIRTQTTEKDQKLHSQLIMEFEHTYIMGDFEAMREILHDKGTFLGGLTKWMVLAKFRKEFNGEEFPSDFLHVNVNKGYSRFGKEVIEIRRNSEIEVDDEHMPVFRSFGEPPRPTERVHRFTFTFKDKKIVGIQHPREYRACIAPLLKWN
jgi:hypothetical protein